MNMTIQSMPLVKLVRETGSAYRLPKRNRHHQINGPAQAARSLTCWMGEEREVFAVIALDAKNRTIFGSVISIGSLTSALVHPREVFRPLVLAGAVNFIAAHNHPSGELNPSAEDYALTKRLREAGDLIGINLLDHIILGAGQAYKALSAACPELFK